MQYNQFGNHYVVRLDRGEEIVATLTQLVEREHIRLASVSGLGAAGHVVAGLFDPVQKQYFSNTWDGDFEILSLTGNISTMDGNPYLHLHIAISDGEGRMYGGHLNEAVISVTGEIIVSVIDGEIDRAFSEEIGVNLIKFD